MSRIGKIDDDSFELNISNRQPKYQHSFIKHSHTTAERTKKTIPKIQPIPINLLKIKRAPTGKRNIYSEASLLETNEPTFSPSKDMPKSILKKRISSKDVTPRRVTINADPVDKIVTIQEENNNIHNIENNIKTHSSKHDKAECSCSCCIIY